MSTVDLSSLHLSRRSGHDLPPLLPTFTVDESAMADPVAWRHTLAALRREVPNAVVMVKPRRTEPSADDLREQHYDRFVGDERD